MGANCSKKHKSDFLGVSYPLDIEKLEGKWFINRMKPAPNKDCFNMTESFQLLDKEKRVFEITYKYNRGKPLGNPAVTKQRIVVDRNRGSVKLMPIAFMPWLSVGYQVIDCGGTYTELVDGQSKQFYQYIVFGHKNLSDYWIMSREPHLSHDRVQQCLETLKSKGFDTHNAIVPKHDLPSQSEITQTSSPQPSQEQFSSPK